jgi:hypothetical protein
MNANEVIITGRKGSRSLAALERVLGLADGSLEQILFDAAECCSLRHSITFFEFDGLDEAGHARANFNDIDCIDAPNEIGALHDRLPRGLNNPDRDCRLLLGSLSHTRLRARAESKCRTKGDAHGVLRSTSKGPGQTQFYHKLG